MTVEEKVAQLGGLFPFVLFGPDGLDPEKAGSQLQHGLGHLSGLTNMMPTSAASLVPLVNAVQRYLVEQTRLGIPALGHSEALSGLLHSEASNFPTAIALAATWDPERVRRMNAIVREEARALGVQHALSPVLDIARDARWGRVHETYGEDPYLCSAMAVAFVRGLQGEGLSDGVIATAKHFVGYGLPEGGRNIGAVRVPERELYEVYCRPFEAAIREAGLSSVMNSYSETNGEVPAASRKILTELLRDRLGFDGVVVADYGSVAMTFDRHGLAADRTDAGIMALRAGLDIELPEVDCFAALADSAVDGRLGMDTLDQAVRRVLTAKFQAGVFEDPYGDLDAFVGRDREEALSLARAMARRSVVLLKNEGGVLPLNRDTPTVAVIGPHADSVRNVFSGYTAPSLIELLRFRSEAPAAEALDLEGTRLSLERVTEEPALGIEDVVRGLYPNTRSLVEAVRAKVGPASDVLHAQGCTSNGGDEDGIAEAVALARRSDVAILALGHKTGWVADATSGEGRDRSTLDLPGRQQQLLAEVTATGVPTVVVLVNGRPAPIGAEAVQPTAVLEAWQPGEVGMDHVAEILFGEVNPSGKLPVTVPRTAGQCPLYYAQGSAGSYEGRGLQRYTDVPTTPAYPFGHGLSYTAFTYESLTVVTPEVTADDSARVTVTLTNSGDRAGEEVVQLYATSFVRGVTRPVKELVGFARVDLEPGAGCTVAFDLPVAMFACIGPDSSLAVHPGPVTLSAGGSSASTPVSGRFSISGQRRPLEHRTAFFSEASIQRDIDTAVASPS